MDMLMGDKRMPKSNRLNGKILLYITGTLLFFIVFIMLTGCLFKKGQGDILIGVVWPFASNNNMFREGVELAVSEINDKGGINGRRLQTIMKDDELSITSGMVIAQSFTKIPGLAAVIGHRNSYVSVPTAVVYENAGILMLSTSSTANNLTQKGYKYIFRDIPSDDESARQLALLAAKRGHRRMVICYAEDSYGISLANSFERHAKNAGIEIVDRISYYGGLKDLETLHRKWKALDFDGIFVAEDVSDGAEFIADAAKAGISVPFMGGDGLDSPLLWEIAGKAAEGAVVSSVFNPQDPRQEVRLFVQNFVAKYGAAPTAPSALGYDGVKLLAAAIEESGSSKPSVITEKLRTFKDRPGAAGYHTFSVNGDDIGKLVVTKALRNGTFEIIE